MTALSVVIVTWNGREMLGDCLRSLEAQADRDVEVVVVDNGSSDGTVAWLRARHPTVRCIEAGENLGFAAGANRGIEATSGDWVATLNNDAVARPGWVAALRAAARAAGPRVGMLQSHVVFRHAPARTNSTGILLFEDGTARDRGFDDPRGGDAPEEVFCPSGSAALWRRTMLDELRLPTGFFDATFFMYLEDVDLGWRARLAGWSAAFVPDAVVEHVFEASSRTREARFVSVLLRTNRVRMLLKNGSPGLCARALPRTVLDACDVLAWRGARGAGALFDAARDGVRQRTGVSALARSPRHAVERRWLAPSPADDAVAARVLRALARLGGRLRGDVERDERLPVPREEAVRLRT